MYRRTSNATLIGTISMLALAAGCSGPSGSSAGPSSSAFEAPARSSVAVGAYPLAAAAEAIGGDCVAVTNLTPPGAEPHDLELTPDDIEVVATADAVLYLGSGFQPALEDALGDSQATAVDVLSLVPDALPPPSEGEDLRLDPHIWLDPGLWASVMPGIADALRSGGIGAGCDIGANTLAYQSELEAIDRANAEGLASCERDLVITNHSAFAYLAAAYGLRTEAISGLEPDAEPTPERLAQLSSLVETEGVTTVFTEELASPEVAETLAAEAGVRTAVLHTLEGLTPEEVNAGADYGSVMAANLDALREALGCSS
jgi:zinc transport system substrate-binding protein